MFDCCENYLHCSQIYTPIITIDDILRLHLSFVSKSFFGLHFDDRFLLCYNYFKYELEAKGAIKWKDLPPFLSSWLDRSSGDCIFMSSQQCTFTTTHLSGKV